MAKQLKETNYDNSKVPAVEAAEETNSYKEICRFCGKETEQSGDDELCDECFANNDLK